MRREDNNYRPQPSPSQQSLATNLKLSIHSSTPSNNKQQRSRRNPSYANPVASHLYSRSFQNSSSSKYSPLLGQQPIGRILRLSRNNKDKPVEEIEFNNVKWISIISAYDSKRLKHVTISKQSCQTFLKKYGPGIKKDPIGNSQFKDMKRNFRCWLQKINDGYFVILDKFLSKGDRSPLMNLQSITPALEDIKFDTHMMQEKLSTCLSVYESREFRQMHQRFHSYLEASLELQEIIGIIVQSKGKIQRLFGDMEKEGIDRRVERIRKRGIKEVEEVVYRGQCNVAGFQNRIIEKVSTAINQMANKSIDCFHKIQGVKELLQRIQMSISSSPSHPDLSSIVTLNKIFLQILKESTLFTQFSNKFLEQGDMIHQDLRNCIRKYQDEVSGKRKVINELQIKFVGEVIGQAGEWLKSMYDVDSVIGFRGKQDEEAFRHKYYTITRLLEEISQCLQDQTKQVLIDKMAKESRSAFARLDDDLTKLTKLHHQSLDHLLLDTEDGYVQILQYTKLIKEYKEKVKILIKKMDDGMRGIGGDVKKRRSWRLPEHDKEVEFLEGLAKLSEQVNLRERKDMIDNEPAFNPLPKNSNIINLSNQIIACEPLLKDLRKTSHTLKQLLSSNPTERIFPSISLSEVIYFQAEELLKMIELVKRVGEGNIVQVAMKVAQNGKGKAKDAKGKWRWAFQRILCLLVKNGVKKQYLKLITDSQSIPFPQNQTDLSHHVTSTKYLSVLLNAISSNGEVSLRPALYLPTQLSTTIKIMQDFSQAYKILQKVRKNELGRYMLSIEDISLLVGSLWQLCIRNQQTKESKIHKLISEVQSILKGKVSYLQQLSNSSQTEHHESNLRIRNAILTYQSINSSLSSIIATLHQLKPLSIYSKLVYGLCDYIHKTHQIAYFVLNEFKEPIWIGEIKDSQKGVMDRIGLEGMAKGVIVDSWEKKEARVGEKQKEKQKEIPKVPTKAKINQQHFDDVEDQIEAQEEYKMDEEIGDQYNTSNNIEDIVEDQIAGEQMDEQIDDAIQDFEDGQQLQEQMGEDIQEEEEYISNKRKDLKPKPKPQSKQQSPIIQQKKPIKIQQVKLKISTKSIYEMIPNIKNFTQIRSLIQLIATFQMRFWAQQINFTEIEAYYNQQENQLKDRTNFSQAQSKKLTKFIESMFQACFRSGIQQSSKVKQMLGLINSLAQKNWINLFKILFKINRSYSILALKNQKTERYLQIHIIKDQPFSEQRIKCIQNYLLSNFKSQHFSLSNFQIKRYLTKCLSYQQKTYKSTANASQQFVIGKYTAQNISCLPSQDTHKQIQSLIKVEKLFMENKQDGIDLLELTYNLWMKAIQYQPEDRKYAPNFIKLDEYMQMLSKVENDKWIGNYIQSVKSNSNNVKSSIKTHKNKIEGLLFRVSKQNVLQILEDLNKTYQPAIRKRILIGQPKSEQIFLLQNEINCEDKLKAAYVTAFDQLFLRIFLSKSPSLQVHLNQRQIIKQLGLEIEKKSLQSSDFTFALNILRILKISHHYSIDPRLNIKDSYQDIILSFFNDCANLHVQAIKQINLQSLQTDVFQKVLHSQHSVQIQLNKTFDRSILDNQHNADIQQRFAYMKKKSIEENQKLMSSIKEESFYRLIWNNIFKVEDTSEFNETLHAVQLFLRSVSKQFDQTIKNPKANLQMYIYKRQKEFLEFSDSLKCELNDMDEVCKSSNSQLTDFQLYEIWISKVICKQNKVCISYKGQYDSKMILLNIEVKEGKNAQKLKQKGQAFGNRFLSDYVFKNCKDQLQRQHFISKFNQEFLQNTMTANKNQVIFDLNAIANRIIESTFKQCLSVTELLQFAQKFNINRFNPNKSIQNDLKKCHQSMIQKLQNRQELLTLFNQIKSNAELHNMAKQFPKVQELLMKIENAFNSHKYKLSNIKQSIGILQSLHPNQKDMMVFGDWFTNQLVKKFKINFYSIKSSQNSMITFIPVLSTDEEAKKEQIDARLKELNLPCDYFIEQVQGIQVINLFQEEIICSITSPKNSLDSLNDDEINQQQLDQFRQANYGVDEEFIWILGIYQIEEAEQTDNEYIPLALTQIKLDQIKCNLNINENATSGTILCYIAKMKKEDYLKFISSHPQLDKVDLKGLAKRMIEIVSIQDKVERVVIGQRVPFNKIGRWLKDQFNKFKKRKEDKEKEQILIKKQKEKEQILMRKQKEEEEDRFLQRIYDELEIEEAVRIKVTSKQIQEHKSLREIPQQQPQLSPTSKKIIQSTMKSMKKLEESLSVQQLSSFQQVSKEYLQILTQKLVQKQQIQQILCHNAEQKYKQSAVSPQHQQTSQFILKQEKDKLQQILSKHATYIELPDKTKRRYQQFLSQLVNESQFKDKDEYLEVIVDEFLKLSKSNKAKLILIDE